MTYLHDNKLDLTCLLMITIIVFLCQRELDLESTDEYSFFGTSGSSILSLPAITICFKVMHRALGLEFTTDRN